MNKSLPFLFILAIIITSCKSDRNEIIPTNFEQYNTINVTNDEEAIEMGKRFCEDCKINTVGHSLPKVIVTDLNNKKHTLTDIITRESIIIAGSDYEGYGRDEFVNSFPETILSLEDLPGDFDVFCLVIDNENGNESFVSELITNYRNIYIISGEDAARLNIYSTPTKLYLNKEKTVVHYAIGYVFDKQYRLQEADEGIKKMFKKRI